MPVSPKAKPFFFFIAFLRSTLDFDYLEKKKISLIA